MDFLSLRGEHGSSAASGSNRRTDRRSLATTRNSADQRADAGSAADNHRITLLGVLGDRNERPCRDLDVLSITYDFGKNEANAGSAFHATGFFRVRHTAADLGSLFQ